MACCPAHDDSTPSLGVTLGRTAILFHCFAGCDQQAVLAALAREGFNASRLFSGSPSADQFEPIEKRNLSPAALRIWREAEPVRSSPAKAYLESRGILAASSALRFHPRTPLGPKGRTRYLPALIAAVSLDEGPIAIHRTFLSRDSCTKADFDKPKRALGSLDEAAVRLFAPAVGKLGLAEGIESAMSAYALTGIPAWATLGNERFGLVSIPESVSELHLFVDYDKGSVFGQADSQGTRLVMSGRSSTIATRDPSFTRACKMSLRPSPWLEFHWFSKGAIRSAASEVPIEAMIRTNSQAGELSEDTSAVAPPTKPKK
jgi:hypothetical protein